MEALKYKGLKITNTNHNKWYVYYVLVTPDGKGEKRKEEGKTYQISLNTQELKENPKLRNTNAIKLLRLVEADLESGVDPKFHNEIVDQRNRLKLIEAQKKEDAKISIDEGIEILRSEKGWINPHPIKQHASNVIPTFLKNSFKKYLIQIKKDDDLRKVNRMDIVNYIEENFNRSADVKKSTNRGRWKEKGWSASTCIIQRTRISLLFNTLINLGLVEENPTTNVKVKKDSEKKEKAENDIDDLEAWSQDERRIWFDELSKSTDLIDVTFLASSALIYYAFIRKSELLRIKVGNIDFQNEVIRLKGDLTKSARKYKKNETILIEMNDELLAILKRYIDLKFPNGHSVNDYLFFQYTSDLAYNYGTYTKHYEKIRARFEGKYLQRRLFANKNQYALKHTGAIALYHYLEKTDKSPAEIQRIIQNHCRHSDWGETERYLRDKCKITIKEKKEKFSF